VEWCGCACAVVLHSHAASSHHDLANLLQLGSGGEQESLSSKERSTQSVGCIGEGFDLRLCIFNGRLESVFHKTISQTKQRNQTCAYLEKSGRGSISELRDASARMQSRVIMCLPAQRVWTTLAVDCNENE
jgi:hypothetical protein